VLVYEHSADEFAFAATENNRVVSGVLPPRFNVMSQPTILCIGDWESLPPPVRLVLKRLGYEVLVANTVTEGLAYAAVDSPEVAFVDYNLYRHDDDVEECIADRIHRMSPNVKIFSWLPDDSRQPSKPSSIHATLMEPSPVSELVAHFNALLRAA
jgi:hypothetical protein